MNDNIINHFFGSEDQTPVKVEVSLAAAASPAGLLLPDRGTGTTIGSTHDDLSVRTDLNCNGFPLTVDNFVRNGKTHTYCTSGL